MERRFREVYAKLPMLAGNEVVNFSLDNFRRQGFMGASFQPWKPRKTTGSWNKNRKDNGRAILVKTGKLRRATRVVSASNDLVIIGNDMPYAKAMNEGVRLGEIQQVKEYTRKISTVAKVSSVKTKKTSSRKVTAGSTTVKAHTRKINQNIPARPFLKDSPYLQRNVQRVIAAAILKALK